LKSLPPVKQRGAARRSPRAHSSLSASLIYFYEANGDASSLAPLAFLHGGTRRTLADIDLIGMAVKRAQLEMKMGMEVEMRDRDNDRDGDGYGDLDAHSRTERGGSWSWSWVEEGMEGARAVDGGGDARVSGGYGQGVLAPISTEL
jgi:hypothetical protein